ncbi:S-layer homology domain-containing protein [Paenibacillus sp. FSL R7-0331]|uniref:S-layer homology domain-containing protein n=1 Tax=Paenibacillus sp. FSL R7-0331 TaxID=1536773 RepID=UPI0018CFD6A5|nr:S-layer homology domain-containing protein [Paenibacillus sp. FSL R7-0331]
MRIKGIIALGLGVTLAFGTSSLVNAAEGSKDYDGHWAQKQIESWLQNGWLKGFEDGSVKPDQGISRAEFITLVNRMWDIGEGKPAEFSDLPKSSWAYTEFSKAVSAGYIQGYEGKVHPNALITRQEAAIIISRLMKFEDGSADALAAFTDAGRIAAWSQPKVAAVVNAGAMKGYPDGSFKPDRPMTRAESVALMESFNTLTGGVADGVVASPGAFGSSNSSSLMAFKNLTVTASGVTLKNMTIHGDLLLKEVTGAGGLTLDNVTVEGRFIIEGSGSDKVYLSNSRLNQMIVQKKSGEVQIIAVGTTEAGQVQVSSGVMLEESEGSGKGFTDIAVSSDLPSGTVVILNGAFNHVKVEAAAAVLKLQKGTLSLLSVAKGASSLQAELEAGTVIARAVLDSAASFIGSGEIQAATVNDGGQGSSFARKPLTVDGSQKESIVTGTGTPVIVAGGGGAGGGSTGGGSNGGGDGGTIETPAPTALPVIEGITLAQGSKDVYTNAATAVISFTGISGAEQAAAHYAGYYFTATAETAPDPANLYIQRLPDLSNYSFPIAPKHLQDYMTVILYDVNNKAIGYKAIKLDLKAVYSTLNEPVERFSEGVTITRSLERGFINDRIAIREEFAAQHPEIQYFTYSANTELPYVVDADKDFNVKSLSAQSHYLQGVTDIVYGYSNESFADYQAPFYTVQDFEEQYMIIFYNKDMHVTGYYQGPSILTDQQAADTVAFKIDQLPEAEKLTLEDEPAVNWVYRRYSNLTEAQKELVSKANTDKIIALKTAIDKLKLG